MLKMFVTATGTEFVFGITCFAGAVFVTVFFAGVTLVASFVLREADGGTGVGGATSHIGKKVSQRKSPIESRIEAVENEDNTDAADTIFCAV